MKIERLNDNQFRCTISAMELIQRHMSLKKLSTDSNDARRLVREMIELSENEVGFEPNELPVMVEAIRNPQGDLVFTITKINSPDELPPQLQPQAEALRALQAIAGVLKNRQDWVKTRQPVPLAIFAFSEEYGVKLPPRLKTTPEGIQSSLYYSKEQGQYFLLISSQPKNMDAFHQVCLLLSEYGRSVPSTSASKAYYAEHTQVIYPHRAIEQLQAENADK